ncbi:MAG: hypothetical protein KGN32_08790 [Burkholderiales bacterium]|nr:hypothetical protein [Burkholderiales bacterium]
MKKKPSIVERPDQAKPYLMQIADLLSDDPRIVQVIGSRFKVVAWVDERAKRVNYSFRGVDDTAPD